jgi:DNA-directed RNA polymerase specialized sigma24 family protein
MSSEDFENRRAPSTILFIVLGSRFPAGARIIGMGDLIDETPGDPTDPRELVRGGNRREMARLFDHHRDRLRRMVELRRDARLRARLDTSDVLQEALNSLDRIDRDMLALRHFEQLGRAEAAQVLGISQEAGAKGYFRALKRLKDALATLPGGWEGL